MVILALCKQPLNVGAVRKGCRDGDGVWREDQPFVIIRETTESEYLKWRRSVGVPATKGEISIGRAGGYRFFEVGMD